MNLYATICLAIKAGSEADAMNEGVNMPLESGSICRRTVSLPRLKVLIIGNEEAPIVCKKGGQGRRSSLFRN